MEASIEDLEAQFRENSEKGVKKLEGMRMDARDVGKAFSLSGLPVEFQRRATDLLMDIESLERDASVYLQEVEA